MYSRIKSEDGNTTYILVSILFVRASVDISRSVLNSIYLPSPPPVSPLETICSKRLVSCSSALETAFTELKEIHQIHSSARKNKKRFIRHLISPQYHQNAADMQRQTWHLL